MLSGSLFAQGHHFSHYAGYRQFTAKHTAALSLDLSQRFSVGVSEKGVPVWRYQ